MLTSPPEIFGRVDQLRRAQDSFVLATVVAVRGSSSAKTGSKAIFDSHGVNILGWVGGGCAESFLARQSLEALGERFPRIVSVDLDDEVFGLLPCGGVMDVYLEPHFPARVVTTPRFADHWEVPTFMRQLGFDCEMTGLDRAVSGWRDLFPFLAGAIAERPLASKRCWPGTARIRGSDVFVFGQSRITQEFVRLGQLVESRMELRSVSEDVRFPEHACVVIASHHRLDHEIIAKALRCRADYVALVASGKRSLLIFEELRRMGFSSDELGRVLAPAGLDLPCETPSQIAFSIWCEMLSLEDESRWT